METKPKKKETSEEHIRRIVTPIFNKVLQEQSKNRMTVVTSGGKYCLYQPHNFRRYIDFSKDTFSPLKPWSGVRLGTFPMENYKLINKTEHSYEKYHRCRVTVKKSQVEIINKIQVKRWYKIGLENVDLIKNQIGLIIAKKEKECIRVLKRFIKEFGGSSKFKILNFHSEDKIRGENYVDQIPLKMHFHTDVVKKVYNVPNVEFSDPAFVSNYLRTRALEDRMDVIDKLLMAIDQKLTPSIDNLSVNLNTHVSVEKRIDKGIMGLNKVIRKLSGNLSQKRLGEYLR